MKDLRDFYDWADLSSSFLSAYYGVDIEDLFSIEVILKAAYQRGFIDGLSKVDS